MQQFIQLTIAFLVVVSTEGFDGEKDSKGCPKSFKNQCSCGRVTSAFTGQTKYIVNCTNSGFDNVDMLQDLPEETEELIFTGNSVPLLPHNVINNEKMYNDLVLIDMSNNDINFIQGKSFHNVYNVETLILNHNNLSIVDGKERPRIFSNFESLTNLHLTNAFSDMMNASYYLLSLEYIFFESDLQFVKKVHLEQNEIYYIGSNESLFCQLPELEHLHLGDNRLSDLNFRIDCLKKLRYIDAQRNSINRLSLEAMRHMDAKKDLTLELQNNPFICDCRSSVFIDWIKHKSGSLRDRDSYNCMDGYPHENIGKTLDQVTDLQCPIAAPMVGYSASVIGTMSFFLVFMSTILLVVAYFHRKPIKDVSTNSWKYLTRQMGYTGLVNEEAPQEVNV